MSETFADIRTCPTSTAPTSAAATAERSTCAPAPPPGLADDGARPGRKLEPAFDALAVAITLGRDADRPRADLDA